MSEVAIDLPDSPYERWAVMRREHPILQENADMPYAVARYEDVQRILKDHETFSSDISMRSEEEKKIRPSMLFSDPPVHNRLRKLVSYAFKPGFVEAQRSLIEAR